MSRPLKNVKIAPRSVIVQRRCALAGPWSEAVSTFASAGFQCPHYKNPTDYFMAIASDDDSMKKMFAVHNSRWATTKRAAFSAVSPTDVDVGRDGLQSISVEPGKGQALAILASPTVCSGAVHAPEKDTDWLLRTLYHASTRIMWETIGVQLAFKNSMASEGTV